MEISGGGRLERFYCTLHDAIMNAMATIPDLSLSLLLLKLHNPMLLSYFITAICKANIPLVCNANANDKYECDKILIDT